MVNGHGQVVAKSAQQVGVNHGFLGLVVDEVGFLLPMGLHENAVDVVDVDGFVGAADGLDQAADAEVAGLAQDAVGRADDEIDGGQSEGVLSSFPNSVLCITHNS